MLHLHPWARQTVAAGTRGQSDSGANGRDFIPGFQWEKLHLGGIRAPQSAQGLTPQHQSRVWKDSTGPRSK